MEQDVQHIQFEVRTCLIVMINDEPGAMDLLLCYSQFLRPKAIGQSTLSDARRGL